VGLCPGHEGAASAHVVVTLRFWLALLHRTALFLLLPDPTLGGSGAFRPLFSHCWERLARAKAVLFSGGFEWYLWDAFIPPVPAEDAEEG